MTKRIKETKRTTVPFDKMVVCVIEEEKRKILMLFFSFSSVVPNTHSANC